MKDIIGSGRSELTVWLCVCDEHEQNMLLFTAKGNLRYNGCKEAYEFKSLYVNNLWAHSLKMVPLSHP